MSAYSEYSTHTHTCTHTHTADDGDIQVNEERVHTVSGTVNATVAVNLRVDQLAMEPLERFRLSLSPPPGFGPDPATEIFIDELTIEIIDNDSEQEWSLSLHCSMPLSLPPSFLSPATIFFQLLPFLTHFYFPSFMYLHMCIWNSSTFFCICLLFPSSIYVPFLPSLLIFSPPTVPFSFPLIPPPTLRCVNSV